MKLNKNLIMLSIITIKIASVTTTYANTNTNVYEKVPVSVPKVYKSSEEYIPKEYEQDINALNDLYLLKPKTDSKFEIVMSNEDKTYTYLDSKDTLEEAIKYVDEMKQTVDSTKNSIPCIIDDKGEIVYSTNAMGKVIKYVNNKPYEGTDKTTDIYRSYSNGQLKDAYTYINHGYIDDVPIIQDNGKAAKVEVNGYEGWVNKDTSKSEYDLRVVPLNQVENPSYYMNNNGTLNHYISSNIESKASGGHTIKIGKAPTFMKENTKYYSYDGNYYYTSLNTLISDAKIGHHNNAVNVNSPHYTYYQYLPFRSETSYSANDLNKFINEHTSSKSKLRNLGETLIQVQEKYGVNAAMILGVAINESGWGMSSLAQSKNNLFGIKAYDSNVAGASSFKTPGDSVVEFAKNYISTGYADPQDWRYKGAHFGNKALGANVKYASDPFWGEKAGQQTYRLDYELSNYSNDNLKDNDKYSLAIHTSKQNVFNENRTVLYSITDDLVGIPMIVDSKKEYENYLEVTPDRPVSLNSDFNGVYDLSTDAYVKSSNIKAINEKSDFYDIKNHWAESAIVDFINKGYINGYADNTFRPNNPITRAEFISIVNSVFGFTHQKEKYFKDVKSTDWYYQPIQVAVGAGYINGYQDDTFRPNNHITRQEVAAIVSSILDKQDSNFDKLSKYKDQYDVSNWAKPAVEGVLEVGAMSGYQDDTFRPKNKMTRAEAVVTLSRIK